MTIKHNALMIAAASLTLIVLIPVIVFFARSPVLIVNDPGFVSLYGEDRILAEQRRASISLFRAVKTVLIADDAADEIARIAISEVSSRPFCVIFPLRFTRSARVFRNENPKVRVILLEGRHGDERYASILGLSDGDYFIFKTDIESDFYRAGLAAASIAVKGNGKMAVFLESGISPLAEEAFSRAVNSLEKPPEILFYASFSQDDETPDVSCVVLAGAGAEYLERETGVPVIAFAWIDTLWMPKEVVIVIDDSPWIQAERAVRMTRAGVKNSLIQSKFTILDRKKFDRDALRKIQK